MIEYQVYQIVTVPETGETAMAKYAVEATLIAARAVVKKKLNPRGIPWVIMQYREIERSKPHVARTP